MPIFTQNRINFAITLVRDAGIILGSLILGDYLAQLLISGSLTLDHMYTPNIYGFVGLATLCVSLLGQYMASNIFNQVERQKYREQFYILYASILLSIGILVFSEQATILSVALFYLFGSIIAFMFTTWADLHPLPASESQFVYVIKNLWERRTLIRLWTWFNLEAKYIESKLGALWIFLQPLLTATVYTFVFSDIIGLRRPRGDIPFIVFFLSGMVVWQFFAKSAQNGCAILLTNRGIIQQIPMSLDILVVVRFGQLIVDFVFMLLITLIICILNGIYPSATYVYIPFILLILFILSTGLMFVLSSLSIFLRDLPQLTGTVVRMMFYFSPVLYSVETAPNAIQGFLLLNPVAIIIESFRNILLYGEQPQIIPLLYPLIIGVVTLYAGFRFFKSREQLFAELI